MCEKWVMKEIQCNYFEGSSITCVIKVNRGEICHRQTLKITQQFPFIRSIRHFFDCKSRSLLKSCAKVCVALMFILITMHPVYVVVRGHNFDANFEYQIKKDPQRSFEYWCTKGISTQRSMSRMWIWKPQCEILVDFMVVSNQNV